MFSINSCSHATNGSLCFVDNPPVQALTYGIAFVVVLPVVVVVVVVEYPAGE